MPFTKNNVTKLRRLDTTSSSTIYIKLKIIFEVLKFC